MEFAVAVALKDVKKLDLLVVPFWKDKKEPLCACEKPAKEVLDWVESPIKQGDFKGKEGEMLMVYPSSKEGVKRILLLGLGEKGKANTESLRRSFSSLVKASFKTKSKSVAFFMPALSDMPRSMLLKGIVEGILLSHYRFDYGKRDLLKEDPFEPIEKIVIVGGEKKDLEITEKCKTVAEAVHMTRDLVNHSADYIIPEKLAEIAADIAKENKKIKLTVFDKKRIEKEKMGLLLAVSKGSSNEPRFILAEYKGNPKSKDLTAIVGKGVTYDTGGLNLKPSGSMEDMRCDMAGAAASLGILKALAALDLKVNVLIAIPTTENSIGSKSFKPGDVYIGHSGKSVEIGNTDAEGRLILADAMSYVVQHYSPTRMIDFATLTGAMVVALGEEATGFMSNSDVLADLLIRSGAETYERVWRFPLFEEYKELLKSDIADMNNIGGRAAGSITAALFLQEFVGKTPWAHLDIAGTAFLSKERKYLPKNATGVGVRLMIDFLENL